MDADLSHNQVEADRIEKEFEIGSSVLYRLTKQTFDKEAARWSKAVYKSLELMPTESKSVQNMVIPSTRHQMIFNLLKPRPQMPQLTGVIF
ncbi:unnamed protein product [Phytophthora lilii]|uniref:Unnamed protein product n=1 Tax=Phytophthora lilii TaxID=2077276 RepID=A0A9W6YD67_9STRA|nr:unnamed protein product [Phytophthora lilii]